MSVLKFDMKPVTEKPSRKYRKGSKYDPIIDYFLEMKETSVSVDVTDKEANYLRTQIKKRIDARELNDTIEVSVINNIVYLDTKEVEQ